MSLLVTLCLCSGRTGATSNEQISWTVQCIINMSINTKCINDRLLTSGRAKFKLHPVEQYLDMSDDIKF